MKSPALNRILGKTPPESLAVLSVSAFLRSDNIEMERIYGALPSHRRESRNEFFIQHHALTESILLWVIEYWRTHSLTQAMTTLIVDRESSPSDILGGNLIKCANKAKLASLIEAMRQICSAQGIAFDDVATFAEIITDIDAQPVHAMVTEFVEMFGIAG